MSNHNTNQRMHKATLFFCLFTSSLLLLLAGLLNTINHAPWGLVGAAIIVGVLTGQQLIRKPQVTVQTCGALENAS